MKRLEHLDSRVRRPWPWQRRRFWRRAAPGGGRGSSTRASSGRAAGAPVRARRPAPRLTPSQVNIVTRVQGTSFFKTAIDITNNTDADGVVALVQYCYNVGRRVSGMLRRPWRSRSFRFDNFHTDDMVEFLGAARRHSCRAAKPLRHASRDVREPPYRLRLGGHGYGADLQPLRPGQPGARDRGDRLPRLALLRVGEHHPRRNDPRHGRGADRCGRTAHEPRRHEHGPEPRGQRQRRRSPSTTSRRVSRPTASAWAASSRSTASSPARSARGTTSGRWRGSPPTCSPASRSSTS